MSLKTIKEKVRSVDRIHTVTKAMEAVSAVKMRASQDRALGARPYSRAAADILRRIRKSNEGALHPLSTPRPVNRLCVIVVTSDKGLAGSLNSTLLRRLNAYLRERGFDAEAIDAACLGKKGFDYAKNRGYAVAWQSENNRDDVSVADLHELATLAADWFLTGRCDEVVIAYPSFVSMFEQTPVVQTLLPISVDALAAEEGTESPTDSTGSPQAGSGQGETIFEPSAGEVLEALIPHLLSVELFHALVEAKAAEHSARMVAMKNASDKAGEMSDELTLELNKARQALITREVSEIISGIETTN